MRLLAANFMGGLLAVAILLQRFPLGLGAIYVIAGCASAALYYHDKRAAVAREWRISEATLHLVDLFGGILGGLLAQEVFRHKTRKAAFAIVTWVTASGHLLLLVTLMLDLWSLQDLVATLGLTAK